MTTIAALLLATLTPQDVTWKTNWAETLKEAKESKKMAVLCFFSKDFEKSKNCKRFQEEALTDPAVIAALNKYVCAMIDPRGPDEDNKLWFNHGKPALPTTYVYDPDGKMLTTVTALKAKFYAEALEAAVPAYFDKIVPAREALAKDPNQPDKLVMLGDAYCRLNDDAHSAENYRKAAEVQIQKSDKKGALETLETQRAQYFPLKWWAQSRDCCRKILELDPSNESKLCPKAAWTLALADYQERKFQEVIDALKAALDKYKDSDIVPDMMLWLATAYLNIKDKDSAIPILEKIVEKYPDTEAAANAQTQLERLNK